MQLDSFSIKLDPQALKASVQTDMKSEGLGKLELGNVGHTLTAEELNDVSGGLYSDAMYVG